MAAPYGAVNAADIAVANSLGLRLVIDSSNDNSITDSQDWAGKTPAQIASLVEASLADWGGTPSVHGGTRIVAFHDGLTTAPNTVKALPLIVAWMNKHHWAATLTLPANTTGGDARRPVRVAEEGNTMNCHAKDPREVALRERRDATPPSTPRTPRGRPPNADGG